PPGGGRRDSAGGGRRQGHLPDTLNDHCCLPRRRLARWRQQITILARWLDSLVTCRTNSVVMAHPALASGNGTEGAAGDVTEQAITGIDIGGTKTQILVARGRETIVDRTIPTDSWRVLRMDADSPALAGIVRELNGGQAPAALAIGSHGCDSGE